MGASRTLLRKLDLDLIARIEASGKPEKPKNAARRKQPRPYFTYRQNYRGTASSVDPWAAPKHVFKDGRNRSAITLNRSDRWPRAKSYAYAREISPSAEPVR